MEKTNEIFPFEVCCDGQSLSGGHMTTCRDQKYSSPTDSSLLSNRATKSQGGKTYKYKIILS
jgi:hypothetical protein